MVDFQILSPYASDIPQQNPLCLCVEWPTAENDGLLVSFGYPSLQIFWFLILGRKKYAVRAMTTHRGRFVIHTER